jgi:hypothetical protein
MSELKKKTHPMTVNGVTYNVSFNMSVIDTIEDDYGSIEAFLAVMQPEVPEEIAEVVVEEGAEPIVLPQKLTSEQLRAQKHAVQNLILILINDAIEAGDYAADEGATAPKHPLTIRDLRHSMTPTEYTKVNEQVIDVMNAAYESATEDPEKN